MIENKEFLTEQLITYIGNKRALLNFIEEGLVFVQNQLNKKKLNTFDVFSGSGIVSRFMKKYSLNQYCNDMENYARIINSCYLTNKKDLDLNQIQKYHEILIKETENLVKKNLNKTETAFKSIPGFISELYAPKDLNDIQAGERCFYTPYNACYIDCLRQNISNIIPEEYQAFFIAPLLSECSIHANTGGIFKGFYKNSKTGIGKFGGNGENALSRIQGKIQLKLPVLSNFKSNVHIFQEDANILAKSENNPKVDLAYMDPPYNQHPYGSNYFMLNLIADYKKPDEDLLSKVSGIPKNWNRSSYNKKKLVKETFLELNKNLNAKYLMISFNNEGFISEEEMKNLLQEVGKLTVLESNYNTYRASRNLSGRNIHVKELLYIVEKF